MVGEFAQTRNKAARGEEESGVWEMSVNLRLLRIEALVL